MAAFEGIVLYTGLLQTCGASCQIFLQLYAVFSLWFLCSWAFCLLFETVYPKLALNFLELCASLLSAGISLQE